MTDTYRKVSLDEFLGALIVWEAGRNADHTVTMLRSARRKYNSSAPHSLLGPPLGDHDPVPWNGDDILLIHQSPHGEGAELQ